MILPSKRYFERKQTSSNQHLNENSLFTKDKSQVWSQMCPLFRGPLQRNITLLPDIYRIIVSAPRASIDGAPLDNTGAIYECPVNPGSCSGLMGDNNGADERLYDTEGELIFDFHMA